MTHELYAHQSRALEELPPAGGYLGFEQGLGKTLTAIRYVQLHGYERVLVVCPAVAIGVWEREIAEASNGVTCAPSGSRSAKAKQLRSFDEVGESFVILNYEALLSREVERAVQDLRPDCVVIDEAQKIKTATAKRSKVLHRLCKDTPALLLSGTPITKNLLDLYSQYKAIDPAIWDGSTWTQFKRKYGVFGGYGGYELVGYQRTDELMDRIRPHTVVARKEDTLDLPTKNFTVVPVPLEGKHWKEYVRMARTGVTDEWVTSTPLEKALRLSQIAGRAKLVATAAQVDLLLEGGEQVVVFYRFLEEGRALAEALNVPNLNGSTPSVERSHMVDDFQAGRTQVFLSQITAGSTAITLTAASHMVYHSLSYAYEDWAQSQDRIHRIGQNEHCFYYYMTATGPKSGITVDHLVLNSLDTKDDIASMVTKNPDLLLPEGNDE